jgi:hypothetical protein
VPGKTRVFGSANGSYAEREQRLSG